MKLRSLGIMLLSVSLSGCGSLGEKGVGLNHLDTITEEDKAQEAWFNSYYGSNHCVWGNCKAAGDEEKAGGGGFWGGGAGPSDSAPSGHSDSSSSSSSTSESGSSN